MNARSASSLTPNQLAVMALDSAEGKLLQGLSTAGQKSIARRELAKRWRFSEKQLTDALQKLTLRGMVRSNRGRVQITSAGVDVVESAKTMPASVADLLAKQRDLDTLVSDFSTSLASTSADQLDSIIERKAQRLLTLTDVDRVCWYIHRHGNGTIERMYSVAKVGVPASPLVIRAEQIPFTFQRLLKGETLVLQKPVDLPSQAEDRRFLRETMIGGLVLVPSDCGTKDIGILGLSFSGSGRPWMPDFLDRLRVFNNLIVAAVERKNTRQLLVESEQRFRRLFEDSPIGLVLENEEGGILFANPAFRSMLGYNDKELSGMRCVQLSHPEDHKREAPLFRQLQAAVVNHYRIEKRFFRKDGNQIWARVHISRLNDVSAAPSLVMGMVEDITDMKKAEEELAGAQASLRGLTHRLIQVQDEERRVISRELHDDIGQRLALLSVELDVLRSSLSAPALDREQQQASRLLGDAQELMKDIHQLSHNLHSSKLQHLGLSAALHELCNTVSRLHHVSTNFVGENNIQRLPLELELCFYRVAQESLNNIMKHSKAEHVSVTLHTTGGLARLEIKDTGVGFDSSGGAQGIGLASMAERLRMAGGTLSVISAPGKGTEIRANVPLVACSSESAA
jgi:PAS domain S-box-containing protein